MFFSTCSCRHLAFRGRFETQFKEHQFFFEFGTEWVVRQDVFHYCPASAGTELVNPILGKWKKLIPFSENGKSSTAKRMFKIKKKRLFIMNRWSESYKPIYQNGGINVFIFYFKFFLKRIIFLLTPSEVHLQMIRLVSVKIHTYLSFPTTHFSRSTYYDLFLFGDRHLRSVKRFEIAPRE